MYAVDDLKRTLYLITLILPFNQLLCDLRLLSCDVVLNVLRTVLSVLHTVATKCQQIRLYLQQTHIFQSIQLTLTYHSLFTAVNVRKSKYKAHISQISLPVAYEIPAHNTQESSIQTVDVTFRVLIPY